MINISVLFFFLFVLSNIIVFKNLLAIIISLFSDKPKIIFNNKFDVLVFYLSISYSLTYIKYEFF